VNLPLSFVYQCISKRNRSHWQPLVHEPGRQSTLSNLILIDHDSRIGTSMNLDITAHKSVVQCIRAPIIGQDANFFHLVENSVDVLCCT
jgi:hypothetical protein